MIILGIETSCDETSVGIIEKSGEHLKLLTNVVATSLAIHSKNGGIIPELAAREQVKFILPVLQQALNEAFEQKFTDLNSPPPPVDAIAVTYGPGLIGSLLVGVETAKTLSYLWQIPLIRINHMYGHIYANWLNQDGKLPQTENLPALILVVSGGHTDLLIMREHGDMKVIGGTRDDAAGEAFDKIARLLGLPYPGGPAISKAALKGNSDFIHFPRPLIGQDNLDFSFSGLKTAVYREVQKYKQKNEILSSQLVNDLAACAQAAIIDVLVKKTIKAVEKYNVKSLLLSGGVAANDLLRKTFIEEINKCALQTDFFVPQKTLCTDNGAMIAAAAAFNYKATPWQEITADPQLYY